MEKRLGVPAHFLVVNREEDRCRHDRGRWGQQEPQREPGDRGSSMVAFRGIRAEESYVWRRRRKGIRESGSSTSLRLDGGRYRQRKRKRLSHNAPGARSRGPRERRVLLDASPQWVLST